MNIKQDDQKKNLKGYKTIKKFLTSRFQTIFEK